MDIEYKIIPNFLDDNTTKFIYYTTNKNQNGILNCILFMKTKEIELLTKKSLIPYRCKIVKYTQNSILVNKINDKVIYTIYVLINEFKITENHYIIQENSSDKIYISLNPGDALLIHKNIFYKKNIHSGYVLELEYIDTSRIILNNNDDNYTYKNLINIELKKFWNLDTWKLLTCRVNKELLTQDIYPICDFPIFANLNLTTIDTFITEANNVYTTILQEDCIFRKNNEWDNSDNVITLMDTINYYNNSKWIIAQYNEKWLNYPLMYYDKSLGGMAEKLCPNILKFLKQCKNIRIAGLSLLKKNGKIKIHTDSTGRSKDSLACHICLIGNGILTVNNKPILQEPKNIIIFDSEYQHSAENPYDNDRIILYIDFVYSKHYIPIKNKVKINIYSNNLV